MVKPVRDSVRVWPRYRLVRDEAGSAGSVGVARARDLDRPRPTWCGQRIVLTSPHAYHF
jgi:hypothetical protein